MIDIKYKKIYDEYIKKYEEIHLDPWHEISKEELDNIYNKEALNIPLKDGVSLYINKLKKMGFEIVFITYRGLKEFDHTDLIIPKYLEKNNIPYDEIITGTRDKYKYLDDCVYFIDDAIRHCEEATKYTNCKVIMMCSDITNGYKNDEFYIARNWKEIFDYIENDVNVNKL